MSHFGICAGHCTTDRREYALTKCLTKMVLNFSEMDFGFTLQKNEQKLTKINNVTFWYLRGTLHN